MGEYISREAVINITAETGAWETQNRVRELPAADVQPVKYAKWILFDKDNIGRAFYCSNCRKVTTTDDFENTPLERDEYFCPRCGARMIYE